ncbi:hypothetical protein LQ567_03040 [Niabella pedocola]|uniref:Polynucleotide kinase-phosphatase ligase domain-containing protein n=1 Tax=Niabella pedocola TaxID=1752077 RepID=A0ABS8PKU3_9BACT|nr:hypothetical protein [Niabella pedocola]MCD2421721.1 hypothetical protein [Niabella pedocola]
MKSNDKIQELRKIRARIDWMAQHKINAFSPTIAPAPKSVERNEIESIYEGLRYYLRNGVQDVVIQRKYMGSYCDIYLHKNPEDTYFVSRNGHKIEHINLTEAKIACEGLYDRFDWTELEIVIIQAELLPWNVLGKGLIEKEFEAYLNAHKERLSFFRESTLMNKILSVKSGEAYTTFDKDSMELKPAAFKAKYPAHIIRQYEALRDFDIPNITQYTQGVHIFENQVTHYGKEAALYFKPFNILKKIYATGREEIPNDNRTYQQINDDEMKVLHLNSELEIAESATGIYEWFTSLSEEMEEGIVIKPLKAFATGLPPAFKVRNNNYLTMIYGVHFQHELEHQVKKRNIRGKLACSINDWAINYQLLLVPYSEITPENYYYKNLMLDRILEEATESRLDHAL